MVFGNSCWKLYFFQMFNLGAGQIGFKVKSNKYYYKFIGQKVEDF